MFLFAGDKILYIENSKDATKKLLELIKSVKLQDTKSTQKNHLHFYTLTTNNQKEKVKKNLITIASKEIKYLEPRR